MGRSGKKKSNEEVPGDLKQAGITVGSLDWRSVVPSKILHQGVWNVCWAVSIALATEAVININRPPETAMVEASQQELIDWTWEEASMVQNNPPTRSFPAWDYVVNPGLCEEKNYASSLIPNPKATAITGVHRLKIKSHVIVRDGLIDEVKILRQLKIQPVVALLDAHSSFSLILNQDKIYVGPTEDEKKESVILHAVLLVGFGSDCDEDGDGSRVHHFVCRNSLGPKWGRGGYGKILRKISFGHKRQSEPSLIRGYSYPVL